MPGSEADTGRVPQWLRRAAPTRLPSTQSDPPSDGWFKGWGECRALIGRLDTILSDLRKYGFTLVTGLFTASALVGGFGYKPSGLVDQLKAGAERKGDANGAGRH